MDPKSVLLLKLTTILTSYTNKQQGCALDLPPYDFNYKGKHGTIAIENNAAAKPYVSYESSLYFFNRSSPNELWAHRERLWVDIVF